MLFLFFRGSKCRINILFAQTTSINYWKEGIPSNQRSTNEKEVIPKKYRSLLLDHTAFVNALKKETQNKTNNSIITIPLPDNTIQRFVIVESSIMATALASENSFISTFKGTGLDDPTATLRFISSANNFHALIYGKNGKIFIKKVKGTANEYRSYYAKDLPAIPFSCDTKETAVPDNSLEKQLTEDLSKAGLPTFNWHKSASPHAVGSELRTYKLAFSVMAEKTQDFGGKNFTIFEVAGIVSDLNVIFERDLSVHLELIADNNSLIFTDRHTDPFSNGVAAQNQTYLAENIGVENYDLGIVMWDLSGGEAALGGICLDANKGIAAASSDFKTIIHELGHLMNADHTFNSCGFYGGRGEEPGSGNTIMGYLGVCGNQNMPGGELLQFHATSYEQMVNHLYNNNPTCGTITNTRNEAPMVEVPTSGFTIPIRTPFTLTGSATDDGDLANLTYLWEQVDKGNSQNLASNPTGTAPIFRSFPYSTSPSRTFPQIGHIVNNTSDIGETLPTYTRELNFRLMVRDNNAGAGGVDYGALQFHVDEEAGPFLVKPITYATTGLAVGQSYTLEWEVANTDQAPVNCNLVHILISYDGGYTFPDTLAKAVANDGAQEVVMPNHLGTQTRLKVAAADNVFFAINQEDFEIFPASYKDFTYSVSPIARFNCDLDTTNYEIEVNALGNLTNNIELSITGLPMGVTSNFPIIVAPTSVNELVLKNLATSTIIGNTDMTITMSEVGGTVVHTQTIHFTQKGNRENQAGTVIAFDGNPSNYISIPASGSDYLLEETEGFTLECWVRVLQGAAMPQTIISKKASNEVTSPGWLLQLQNNGQFAFLVSDGVNQDELATSTYFANQEWYHLAIIYKPTAGTAIDIYVNGVAHRVSFDKTAGNINNTEPIEIGKSNFQGELDEIRIWNTAKNQDAIRENMHVLTNICQPDLISSWQFNETGNLALDLVGGYDGTIMGEVSRLPAILPTGSGAYSKQKEILGLVTFGATDLSLNFTLVDNLNTSTFISKIEGKPFGQQGIDSNHLPLEEEYWIYDRTRRASLNGTLIFKPTQSLTADFSNYKLYKRPINGIGGWTYLNEANAVDLTNNTLTFPLHIDYTGQLLLTHSIKPEITLSKTNINFWPSEMNTPSLIDSFEVSAVNVFENMTIDAPIGFKISLDPSSSFTNQLILSGDASNLVEETIYAYALPDAVANFQDTIKIQAGIVIENVLVHGSICDSPSDSSGTSIKFSGGDLVQLPKYDFNLLGHTIEVWSKLENSCLPWTVSNNFWSSKEYSVMATQNELRLNGVNIGLAIPQQEWIHLAIVFETTTPRIFLNGVEFISENIPPMWNKDFDTYIGSACSEIDEFRLWNTTRTPEEIRTNMHLTLDAMDRDCEQAQGLLFYYQFNEADKGLLANSMGGLPLFSTNALQVSAEDATLPISKGFAVKNTIDAAKSYTFDAVGQSQKVVIDYTGRSIQTGAIIVNFMTGEGPNSSLNNALSDNFYWVINEYGASTIDTAQSITFTLPSTIPLPENANPAAYQLYQRAFNAIGDWTLIENATSVNVVNKEITFETLLPYGQFIIVVNSCGDGIQNGDETGIDCGGSICNSCTGCTDTTAHNYDSNATIDDNSCETCGDGIQNGDETGIDCGGMNCSACIEDDCPPSRIMSGVIEGEIQRIQADTIISTAIIGRTSTVTYSASQIVLLKPDFTVIMDCEFLATIEACTTSTSRDGRNNALKIRTTPTEKVLSNQEILKIYPNPFRESVQIVYQLNESTSVSLAIYNRIGQKVSDIITHQPQGKGAHQAVFVANNLPAGLYFARLVTNDGLLTKPLVLLK